jgi:hypothetical protein
VTSEFVSVRIRSESIPSCHPWWPVQNFTTGTSNSAKTGALFNRTRSCLSHSILHSRSPSPAKDEHDAARARWARRNLVLCRVVPALRATLEAQRRPRPSVPRVVLARRTPRGCGGGWPTVEEVIGGRSWRVATEEVAGHQVGEG